MNTEQFIEKDITDQTTSSVSTGLVREPRAKVTKDIDLPLARRPAEGERPGQDGLGQDTVATASGSEVLVNKLIDLGVETIFGYPGGAIMPIYDALYDKRDCLRHILVRHEQGATHAAEGYARIKGKPGVCMATSGPGATNLLTGMADALMDSVPMICITGQVPSAMLGTEAFQEADIVGSALALTKWAYQITSALEVEEILERAFRIATSGRPGPVLIDITKNAQIEKIPVSRGLAGSRRLVGSTKQAVVSAHQIEELARLIAQSSRPMIFAGNGVAIAGAEGELLQFAEKTGMPVACTLHGLSSFPTGHPQYVGMLGMHGNYAPNVLSAEADLVLAVGMRFDDRVTGKLDGYLPKAKVVHVDIDFTQLGRLVRTDLSILADAKSFLEAALPVVQRKSYSAWFSKFEELSLLEMETVIMPSMIPSGAEIRMSQAVDTLSRVSGGNCVVVADVGQNQMMAARYYRFQKTKSFLSSGGLGTMGFALPAGIGACIANPEIETLVIAGDGGFQMSVQELATISQEQLPVKVVILNNSYLGMVRQWQHLFFQDRYSFVEMKNPDFVLLAHAYGIQSSRATSLDELEGEVKKMFSHDGAYLLEIVVEKEEDVFPMVPAGALVSDMRLR